MSQQVPRVKIWGNLLTEVVRTNLCVSCGTCVAVCPVASISMVDDKPNLTSICIACGMCYNNCPRSGFSEPEIEEKVFGRRRREDDEQYLGVYHALYSARSKDENILSRSQDGGAVTSMLTQLMRDDPEYCMVVTGLEKQWHPIPVVATSTDQLLDCSGTKYTPSPVIEGLRAAVQRYKKEYSWIKKVAVVGTACQMRGTRKMQCSSYVPVRLTESTQLGIGLFCFETFDYKSLMDYLKQEQLDPARITRFEIKKGRFKVFEKDQVLHDVPVRKTEKMVRSCCQSCTDFTSEFSDLSVGSVGSPDGWCTIIVRTEKGERALDRAAKGGLLEVKPLEEVEPGLKEIVRLVKLKRERAEKSKEKK